MNWNQILFGLSVLFSMWMVFFYMRKVHQFYGVEYFDQNPDDAKIPVKRCLPLVFLLVFLVAVMFYQKTDLTTIAFSIFYLSIGVAISITDLSYHVIPDRYHLFGLVIVMGELATRFNSDLSISWEWIILNLVFTLFLLLTGFIYQKIRGLEGLGMGDVKLLIWMGVVISELFIYGFLLGIIVALFVQCVHAIIKGKSMLRQPFALGPYLVTGFMTVRIFKNQFPIF